MTAQEHPFSLYEQAEAALMDLDTFKGLVGGLALPELVVSNPRARKPMEALDDYQLVPIWGTGRIPGRRQRSTDLGGYTNETEPGITVEYWETGVKKPHTFCHINARRGMLLTKNNQAVAVTSAGINHKFPEDEPAELVIRQIQGLVKNDKQPELAKALRAGFLWRDTFVAAWEKLAAQIPTLGRIALSPDHSTVPDKATGYFWQNHRETADRMGYVFDQNRQLWAKDLAR